MQVDIGGILIGPEHSPHVLADIDVYFQSDEAKAFRLVDAISRAGCRFLKGAVLSRADLCLPGTEKVTYFNAHAGKTVEECYADVISRHLVSHETLERVLGHGRSRGLLPILSVYDDEGVAFALGQGAVAIKIPSSNITHAPLIGAAVQTGLPILIDTGRSTLAEIDRAVGWALAAGAGGRLIVEHSPAGPPAGVEKAHLRILPFLAQRYGCPVGLSDHAIGLDMLPIAVALGASILEKGLVVDKATVDIDVAHAMGESDLPKALALSHQAWHALGSAPRPENELPLRSIDRMGLVARRALEPGERIGRDCVRFAFPPVGIGVEHWNSVEGASLEMAVGEGEPVRWNAIGRAQPDAKA